MAAFISRPVVKGIIFVLGCSALLGMSSYTTIVDARGFGCSLSPCLDTRGIDQSEGGYEDRDNNPVPAIRDTYMYVSHGIVLAPSFHWVKSVLPESTYAYGEVSKGHFFIDRADETFLPIKTPGPLFSPTDDADMRTIASRLLLLSLVNVPVWLLYSTGMLVLARRYPALRYVWAVLLLFLFIGEFMLPTRSVEHFG